jgi:LmbE family N-acetylglucosaminyl deacetylase
MAVLAHPDDESLGTGGTLVKYALEGVDTYLVTATRGERGRYGNEEHPGLEVAGKTREAELRAAAKELGIKEVNFLDYIDRDLDQADPRQAIDKIVNHLRRVKPQVVITFGPDGAYGHPDHIAISQFATAAVICAADSNYESAGNENAYRIQKLYYIAWPQEKWKVYQEAFRDLKITVDGVERRVNPWPDWAVTTIIDTAAYWENVWRAVSCHKTQIATYSGLENLSEKHHQIIWGTQQFYRAFSLVNGGRRRESDLFEGLR